MLLFFKGNKIPAFAANLLLVFCLLAHVDALAITYTFTGTGNWNVPGNWDANGIPPSTLPSGDAIIIEASGTCDLTTDLTFAQGSTFTVNTGKQFDTKAFDLTNNGTFNMFGNFNSSPGIIFTNNSTGLIINTSIIYINGMLNNAGNIQHNGGSWFLSGNGNINTGTIQINGTSIFYIMHTRNLNNSGLIEINSPASFVNYGTFTNNLTVDLKGAFGNGDGSDPGSFTNNGTLKGIETFRNVNSTFTNSSTGIIAPGAGPGKLTITGSASLGSGAYHCEINGAVQGSSYDWLAIGSTATIAAGSKLNIVFGYNPTVGATFNIITASTVSGTFSFPANVSFSGGGVVGISLSYPGGNSVRVTVSSVLPVELVSFSAREQQNKVLLHWSTATEHNNRGFEVQRSGNGKDWDALDFVAGNGTATDARNYAYLDEKPLPDLNYYRLRQIDFDEQEQFSLIVTMKLKQAGNGFSIYPNPAKGDVNLAFESGCKGEATLVLYGPMGERLRTKSLTLYGNTVDSNVDLSGLPGGVYRLEIQLGNERWQERLVVGQ